MVLEDPADLMHVLSTDPIRVLVNALKRDRRAVMRDVRLLESFGLLETREAQNPGHGPQRIVAPLSGRFQLVANI